MSGCIKCSFVVGMIAGLSGTGFARAQAPGQSTGVFPRPARDELERITFPDLREELLEMAAVDQVARKTGT